MLPPLAEQGTSRSVLGQWAWRAALCVAKKNLIDSWTGMIRSIRGSLIAWVTSILQQFRKHTRRDLSGSFAHTSSTHISAEFVSESGDFIYDFDDRTYPWPAKVKRLLRQDRLLSMKVWIAWSKLAEVGFRTSWCLPEVAASSTKGQTICSNTVVVYADAQDIPVSPQSHVESPTPRGTTSNRCRDYPIFEPLRYQIGKWPAGRIALLPSDVYNIRKYIGNI